MVFNMLFLALTAALLPIPLVHAGSGGGDNEGGGVCFNAVNPLIGPTGSPQPSVTTCSGGVFTVDPVFGACPTPGTGQKYCIDTIGDGIDFETAVTSCSDSLAYPGEYSQVTVDANAFVSAMGFPGGTIDCTDAADIQKFSDFLLSQGLLGVLGASANVCTTGTTCPNKFREDNGRKLMEGDGFDGTEPVVTEILQDCGDYDYEGLLHVTDHLYALAVPSEEAQQAGCPFIATHAVIGDRSNPSSNVARKEIKLWSHGNDFDKHFPKSGSYSFGNFNGNQVADAFFKAETSNPKWTVYDVVENNCGTFIVSLADKLGVKIDSMVTGFVTRRLLANAGEHFVAKVRESVSFPSIVGGGKRLLRSVQGGNTSDEDILGALVETTAANLFAN